MLLTRGDTSKILLAATVHYRDGPCARNLAATVSCPCSKSCPSKPAALSCAPAREHCAREPAGSCRPAARWPEPPAACSRCHRSEQLHQSQAVSVTPTATGSTDMTWVLATAQVGHSVLKQAQACGHPELSVLLPAAASLMQQGIQKQHFTRHTSSLFLGRQRSCLHRQPVLLICQFSLLHIKLMAGSSYCF